MSAATEYKENQNYVGPNAPDPAKLDREKDRLVIHPDTVVSRQADGTIVSRFKDDIWDLSPYGARYKTYFIKVNGSAGYDFKQDKKLVKELAYAILIKPNGNNQVNYQGVSDLIGVLKRIHKTSNELHLPLKSVLEDTIPLLSIAKTIADSKAGQLKSILDLINKHGKQVGVELPIDSERDNALYAKAQVAILRKNQTPLIPERIWFASYRLRMELFEEIEQNIDGLCAFVRQYNADPHYGRAKFDKKRGQTDPSKMVPMKTALEEHGLLDCLEKHGILKKGKEFNKICPQIIGTCAHLIGQSTGMRSDESRGLKHGCFHHGDGERPPFIKGIEKKSGNGEHDWVTHEEIGRVVKVLEALGNAILDGINIAEKTSIPLLIKTNSLLSFSTRNSKKTWHESDLGLDSIKNELSFSKQGQKEMIITEEDMAYIKLHHVPGRFDNDEDIAVGKSWPFTKTHSYRRSYAVYALNSRFVGIDAIAAQLAHGVKMAAYYSTGGLNSEPLVSPIADEMEKIKNEEMAIRLVASLYTEHKRFPAEMQAWKENKFGNQEFDPNNIEAQLETKEQIMADVKAGRRVIKPTLLGECASLEACDGFTLLDYEKCGPCDKAIKDEVVIKRNLETSELGLVAIAKFMTPQHEEYKKEEAKINFLKEQLKEVSTNEH